MQQTSADFPEQAYRAISRAVHDVQLRRGVWRATTLQMSQAACDTYSKADRAHATHPGGRSLAVLLGHHIPGKRGGGQFTDAALDSFRTHRSQFRPCLHA